MARFASKRESSMMPPIFTVHQIIENIIHTFDVSNIVKNDPWSGILAATMFTVRVTYHTTLQASPMQILFGRYDILNIKHSADWEHI